MAKRIYLITLIAIFLISCRGGKTPTNQIVATNAWTAAYAIAAGAKAEDVSILTPFEMLHPSEHELRPGDIALLAGAQMVIYAGYETMMDQIKTGLNIPAEKLVHITTSYNFEEIESSVMTIAKRLQTEEIARQNLDELRVAFESLRQIAQEHGLHHETAAVHFFQQTFIQNTQIVPLAIFGPAPPEPRLIHEITNSGATLIIDNAHNPSGEALKNTMPDARYVLLLNFPGLHGTRTIQDVIEYNTSQLLGR